MINNFNQSLMMLVLSVLLLSACSQEQQNKITRAGVTWLEGDYQVTYADGNHVKTWVVKDGKVTSDADKGYYYFWATVNEKQVYVQTPIARTYIEETK